MLTLVNLFSYWHWILGFGAIGLLIGVAVFFGVWPVISAFLTPIFGAVGNFLAFYLEDYEEGFKVVSASGPAVIFVLTTMWAVHVADKYYFVPKENCAKAVASAVADLHRGYRFLPR